MDNGAMKYRRRDIDAQRALGAVVPVDPDEADEMGLMEETALSLEDALAARFDGDGVPVTKDGVRIPVASAAELPQAGPANGGGEDAGDGGNSEFAASEDAGEEDLDNGQG